MLSPPSAATQLASLIHDSIDRSAASLREEWCAADGTTTRTIAIDNLLPDDVAREAYEAFPADAAGFKRLDSFRERKHTCSDLSGLPPILATVTAALQNEAVIGLIEQITGFTSLEPDPSLYAGGVSMMRRGDFLNPHIDNSHCGAWHRYRRLNLLYYVTPDWSSDDGGHLELWDAKVRRPATIEARFNRLVIMETNRTSWHSVRPIKSDRARCCVSSYYFSQGSPDGSDYYHVTSFTGRPGQRARRAWGGIDNRLRQARRLLIGHQQGR